MFIIITTSVISVKEATAILHSRAVLYVDVSILVLLPYLSKYRVASHPNSSHYNYLGEDQKNFLGIG